MKRESSDPPQVSMIVPIYNGGPHYPSCFASLCELAYPPERLEVHIIDDCSIDGTREFLRAQSPPAFIRLHFPPENLGRAQVSNLGLGLATGEVIIYLDGDMEVLPDFVQAHVAELAKPGREVIVGRVKPAAWVPRTRLNRYLYGYPLRGARRQGPNDPIGFQYLICSNAALSVAAAEAGGRFQESLTHHGGKDTLFAYRVARKFPNGIYYSDRPAALHHEDQPMGRYLRTLFEYGYHNLPQIISRSPEIATPLAADFAWPLPGRYFRSKRMLGRMLFNPLTVTLARGLLPLLPYPASGPLVRFLVVAAVVRGLRKYVREHEMETSAPGIGSGGPSPPNPG